MIAPGTDLKFLFVHSSSTHPDVFKLTLSNQVYCPPLKFEVPLENIELSLVLNDSKIAFFTHWLACQEPFFFSLTLILTLYFL